jgi:hypothetical protein
VLFHTDRKQIEVTDELKNICSDILKLDENGRNWSNNHSLNEFKSDNFSGGWDIIEQEFSFYYYENKLEYLFGLTIDEIRNIVDGKQTWIILNDNI